jgi:hypothetical protein
MAFRLQLQSAEPFVRVASVAAAFLVMPIALVWMLLPASSVTPSHAPAPQAARPLWIAAPDEPGAPRLGPSPDVDRQDSAGTVDLYGNEVSDAVAKYRVDTTGSVYELHSPHTELPKLRSPKT